jgi:hypothetical protein
MTEKSLSDTNRSRFGMGNTTPQGKWYTETFTPRLTDFTQAFKDWLDPEQRTHAKTRLLTNAEKTFMPEYRQLYNLLKSNPLVTDNDLEAAGFPARPTGEQTTSKPPKTHPEAKVVLPEPAVVEIHFLDEHRDGKSKAKPKGVHGAEIRWAILDAAPEDWEQLIHSVFDTHTPIRLSFSGYERGKTLYFALRWENNIGEKGPWSPIQSAIIP